MGVNQYANVFVRNIDPSATSQDLEEVFNEYFEMVSFVRKKTMLMSFLKLTLLMLKFINLNLLFLLDDSFFFIDIFHFNIIKRKILLIYFITNNFLIKFLQIYEF